jgi:CRP-like cAMP-binding protein
VRSGGSEAARVGTARRGRVVGGASLLRRAATWSGCTAVIDVASQCGSLQPERAKRHIDRMGVLSNWPRNRLLLALPSSNLRQLMPELEHFRYQREQVLMDADSSLEHVFFPDSGVVSVVAVYADGSIIEAATIGREGCTAVQAVFGAKSSSVRFLVQIPGDAAKMSRAAFTRAMGSMPPFRRLMFAYVQAFLEQVLVSVACNGAHSLKERLARWLLMMGDRGDDDTLQITQNLLAEMLGVQRPSITNAARELERAGLIERGRRQVTILDRKGLMKESCECYQLVRARVAFHLPKTYR